MRDERPALDAALLDDLRERYRPEPAPRDCPCCGYIGGLVSYDRGANDFWQHWRCPKCREEAGLTDRGDPDVLRLLDALPELLAAATANAPALENERLRRALAWYADRYRYIDDPPVVSVWDDQGEIARAALAPEEGVSDAR
jgi:hypothetical protein